MIVGDEVYPSLSPEMGAELAVMRNRHKRVSDPGSMRPLSVTELAVRNARSKQFYYLMHYITDYN